MAKKKEPRIFLCIGGPLDKKMVPLHIAVSHKHYHQYNSSGGTSKTMRWDDTYQRMLPCVPSAIFVWLSNSKT